MERLWISVKPERLATTAQSKHGKVPVLQVGDQHQARRMCNSKRHLCSRYHGLRCDAACPEHRNLVGFDRHGIAVVGLRNVFDADQMRMSDMDRRSVYR